ncbi:MAG: endolytic transglycosylase MltG [Bacteroidota bacterium]
MSEANVSESRPKRRWWKWLLGLLVLGGVGLAGGYYLVRYVPNTEGFEGERGVKIPRGADFAQAADSLEAAGLLDSRRLFEFVGYATGWAQQVKAGYYEFEDGASTFDLLDRIRKGLVTPLRFTVPPGTRPGVIAALARRDLDVDSTAFREALRDPELLADLGTDEENVFGYMLPNTYQVYWGTSAEEVVRRLKREFDRYMNTERKAKAEALNLTPEEVVRMAAIVEWEARHDDEKARIAGVYLNRLDIGMRLQADPTVQYALMQQDGGRMRRLLFRDYEVDHPYNTYRRNGLPPGAINNPSPTAIDAVLNSEDHAYLYFVADGTGRHRFSRTLREHNNAANAYRRLMRERRRNG